MYSQLYGDNGDEPITTKSGEVLYAQLDKAMATLLAFYGISLDDIKHDVNELNSEGLSPVKKLILPQAKIMGLDLEFDPELKFPEVE